MKYKKVSSICLLQAEVLIVCLLPSLIHDVLWKDSFIFFLFQLFDVFVPGLALLCLLRKTSNSDTMPIIAWSYVGGILFLLLEYLLIMALNLSDYACIVGILAPIISAFVIKKKEAITCDADSYFVLLLLAATMIISFFSVTYQNPLPTMYGKTTYDKDFLFWVGNSISFTKGLPVQSFRLVGSRLYYHYFSNVVIASASLITGIDVYTLSYSFSFIVPCILLSTGAHVLVKKVTDNKLLSFIGIVGILLCEGSTTFLTNHLYFCAFGFDYGYALSMLGISLLMDMVKSNDYSCKNIIITSIMIMLITGFKGPNGIVILMGFGIVSIALLIKKEWKKGLICGFCWLFSFLFVYCFFIADVFSSVARTNGLELLGLGGAFDKNSWAIAIFTDLLNKGFSDNAVTRIVAIALYVFRSNRLSILLLILCSLEQVICLFNKKTRLTSISLIMICVWGIALTVLTHQDGNSQMYFAMSAVPFGIAAGIDTIDRIIKNNRIALLVVCLVLALVSFDDVRRCYKERIVPEINNSIAVRNGEGHFGDDRYTFTVDEYNAALWLKENTNQNSYIALDEFEYDGFRKEEGFGVFSERFIWNDGQYDNETERNRRRNLVAKLISGDMEVISDLNNENVEYIIITNKINKDFELNEDMAKLKYNNGGYRIYQLKD